MSKASERKTLRVFGDVITRTPTLQALLNLVYETPGISPRDYATQQDYKRDCNTASRDGREVTEVVWRILALGRNAADVENTLQQRGQRGRMLWKPLSEKWQYVAGQYYCTEYRDAARSLLESVLHDLQPVED